jgi:hypothetical protein
VTAFLAILIAAAVGGLIQRPRTSDEARWRYMRGWMLFVVPFVVLVGGAVVVGRGLSTSSLAMTGAGALLTGTAMLLLYDADISYIAPDDDGWRWLAFGSSGPSAWRRWLCVVWGILSLGYLVVALHYGGAFVHDPALEKISAIAALGQFEPLRAYRPVEEGQCLDARDVGAHNEIGDCSLPHRSEIAKEIDEDDDCPDAGAYPGTGLDLKVEKAGPFDGSLFCILQSTSPLLRWVGRLLPHQLAGST